MIFFIYCMIQSFFLDRLIEFIKDEFENWVCFYKVLEIVFGFVLWQEIGFKMGIIQYDYSQIDEDIFGRVYEIYLVEKRKEKGIYYIFKYVIQFIVEEIFGKRLNEFKEGIIIVIWENDFEIVERFSKEFFEIKVVDFVLGLGLFFIKVFRGFWDIYLVVIDELKKKEEELIGKKILDFFVFVQRKDIIEGIVKMREFFLSDERILMFQMVLRYVFVVDFDENVVEVVKMNFWREFIKFNFKVFCWDNLGENEYVFLNLSLNFVSGDLLFGFVDFKILEGREEVRKFMELWEKFIENFEDLEVFNEIKEIKEIFRGEFDERYWELLREKFGEKVEVLNNRFIYYLLEFFMVFFNLDGLFRGGFDFIVGNLFYVRIQNFKKESFEYVEFLNRFYESVYKNYDLVILFIERGYNLFREGGEFGFIVIKKWMKIDYGEKFRGFLLRERVVRLIIDFGDEQVFKGVMMYIMIFVLRKERNDKLIYVKVEELKEIVDQFRVVNELDKWNLERLSVIKVFIKEFFEKFWVFLIEEEKKIVEKIYNGSKRLGEVIDIFVGF